MLQPTAAAAQRSGRPGVHSACALTDLPVAHLQALVKHPDKNPDNPNAAAEFAALQSAYAILTDAEARKALDSLLK